MSIYANDPDYDAYHGRVVGEYTVKRTDRRRNCTIWTTYEVIDVGRGMEVEPADADSMIDELEAWREADELNRDETGITSAERVALAQQAIAAYLLTHPLTKLVDLVEPSGMSRDWVRKHLLSLQGDRYVRVRHGNIDFWGLVDIDYDLDAVLPDYVQKARAAIRQYGPLPMATLCDTAGISKGGLTGRIAKMNDIFCKAGYRQEGRFKVALWGLVGVHDQQVT